VTEPDRERLETLAALVAGGAATPQEHRELDAFVDAHPEAAAEAKAFADAAAMLAEDIGEVAPPPNALAAIRAAVVAGTEREDSPRHAGAQIIAIAERRKKLAYGVAFVAAAAAAVFAMLWNQAREDAGILDARMWQQAYDARTELAREVGRADQAELELDRMRRHFGVATSPQLRLASVANAERGSHAKILIDPDGRRWLVVAHELPPAPPGKDYQMWIVPKGEGAVPIPAGLLRADGDVLQVEVALPPNVDAGAAAISLENAGGVDAPTDVQMIGPI
jgi:hypothetical protein